MVMHTRLPHWRRVTRWPLLSYTSMAMAKFCAWPTPRTSSWARLTTKRVGVCVITCSRNIRSSQQISKPVKYFFSDVWRFDTTTSAWEGSRQSWEGKMCVFGGSNEEGGQGNGRNSYKQWRQIERDSIVVPAQRIEDCAPLTRD